MSDHTLLARAQRLKHAAWLWRKQQRERYEPMVAPAIDAGLRSYSRIFPPRRGVETGVSSVSTTAAPRQLFCLWTGTNSMSPARVRAMESIRRHNSADLDVVLVTPDNLADWVVDGHPLHRAYEHLALIHRADYLRTYLMHHHGGGYTDVKEVSTSWSPVIDEANAHPEVWVTGYRELSYRHLAPARGAVHRSLVLHHHRMLGNGGYVVKPRTPFTTEWLAEVERRLDAQLIELRRHPGTVYGDNAGYPIAFYSLLGEIFHPLCLRWNRHLAYDERTKPKLVDYK